jgi:hypothetical protein
MGKEKEIEEGREGRTKGEIKERRKRREKKNRS